MYRTLLILGGLLVGLLATLFAVPAYIDWNRYRAVFEEEASRLLGREVRVGGHVNLRLLPVPFIRFERVRIADTAANVGEPLLKADDFTVWLAVGPLLSGALQASEVELSKPVLTLVLDGAGGGNWSTIAATKPQSLFLPTSVTLEHVRITNGAVAVLGPKGEERTRFDRINGELSAAALEGPYRVNVAFASQGAARELRFSTAKSEGDGTVRFKGTVRAPDSGTSYTLDGEVRDLLSQTKVQGELTAKLPLPDAPGGHVSGPERNQPANGGPEQRGQTSQAAFDLKAQFKADTAGLELSDIALSFEQDGRPQLASGSAQVKWRNDMDVNVSLQSHWLDLDRISGGPDVPMEKLVRQFTQSVEGVLPLTGRTVAQLNLEQATIRTDVVSAVKVELERSNGILALKSLNAGLPGGSRISATGILMPQQSENLFQGDLSLRGASLARFLAWAARGQSLSDFQRDGPFSLNGRVEFGADRASGRGLTVQYAGNSVTGEARWTGGAQRQIVMALEGSEIDVSPLVEAGQTPFEALRSLTQRLTAVPAVPAATGGAAVAPDIRLRLRIGRFVAGSALLRDVVTDLTYTGGNLSIPLLSFGSEQGWRADLQGDIAGLTQSGKKGKVTGSLVADTDAGVSAFAAFLGLPETFQPSLRRAAAISPLRLAGRLLVGEGADSSYDLTVDGMMASSRVGGSLRLRPDGQTWRDHRIDVAVTVDGGETTRLLAQVLPDSWMPKADATAATPARAVVRGIGTPSTGVVALAAFDAAGISAEFRGRSSLSESAALNVDGDVRIAAEDIGRLAAMTGYGRRPGLDGVPLAGTVAVSSTEAGAGRLMRFASKKLMFSSTPLSGEISLAGANETRRIDGRVNVGELSLPRVLSLLTAGRPAVPPAADRKPSSSVWPEDPFDLALLAGLDGKLRIETPRLGLTPDIAMGAGVIEAEVKSGQLDLRLTEAAALQGRTSGTLRFEKAPAGAHAVGNVQISGARLDSLRGQSQATGTSGVVNLRLEFEGTALSPRGIVGALRGKGELELAQARLSGMAASGVRLAADAVLAQPGEITADTLKSHLDQALRKGIVSLGHRTIALDLTDGILRFAPLVVDAAEGRLTGTSAIDLDGQRFDSEWRIDPRAEQSGAGRQKPALPGISVVYTGPLSSLGSVEPRLQYDALERELAVRKMERDVDALERLRRQDEDRARQEAERQKRSEIEQLQQTEQQRNERSTTIESSSGTPAAAGILPAPATPPAAQPDPLSGLSTEIIPPAPVPAKRRPPAAPTSQGSIFRNMGESLP